MGAEAIRRLRTVEGPEPGDEPTAEPMRAQRRGRSKPSREDLRVRNRTRRSYETPQARTATLQCQACGGPGYVAPDAPRCSSCGSLAVTAGGHLDETDWDRIHPNLEEIHRGVGMTLPDDLHKFVHDPSKPQGERAKALLYHLASEHARNSGDHRVGLGVHWTSEPRVAESFGEDYARWDADADKKQRVEKNDHSWGTQRGYLKDEDLTHHLLHDHGVRATDESDEGLARAHEHMHKAPETSPGQGELFNPGKPLSHSKHFDEFYDSDPKGKPGTAIVLHSPRPERDQIDDEGVNGDGSGMVFNYEHHGEREVPIKTGSTLPISGISWREKHTDDDEPDDEPQYTHHSFVQAEHHEAKRAAVFDCQACGHMSREASRRCRACGSLAIKTATVLMTQIERANPGDAMRTPQGQTVHVKKVRPHETDNTKIYVDTDLGTAVMSRGTEVNLTQGERQQELPDSGNPSGNAGHLPGAGRTPTGEGGPDGSGYAAPRCPRDGTKMVQRGNTWICPVDNTTAPLSSAPAGMQPTNRERGQILTRSPGRKPPQTHLWATYHTAGQPPAIVRRARQVLDTMEEIRS